MSRSNGITQKQLHQTLNDKIDSVGDLSTLQTENKDKVVNSLNELKSNIDAINDSIGSLSELETINNDNIIVAINETITKFNETPKELNASESPYNCPGNGENITSTLKQMFVDALAKGIKKIKIPAGKYTMTAYPHTDSSSIPVLPEGLIIEGDGYNTEIKTDHTSFTTNIDYRQLYVSSYTEIRNIRFNGQKDLVNRGALTSLSFQPIRMEEDAHDIIFKHFYVHDVIGVNKESFGIQQTGQNYNVKYIHCKGWNVEGTPFHVAGDYLNNKLSYNFFIDDLEVYNNTWMGVSVYGAENSVLRNVKSYNNTRNGINLEWCNNIQVIDPICYGNGVALGTFGKVNAKIVSPIFFNNGTDSWATEINIRPGEWYQGSSAPKGNAGTIEIINPTVTPASGKTHLQTFKDDAVNVGNSIPDKIIISGVGVEKWLFENDYKEQYVSPCIEFGGLKLYQALTTPALVDWTKTGTLSTSAYASGGNIDSGAVTVSATAQYANMYTDYILKANSRYLVKIRAKITSSSTWNLLTRESSGAKIAGAINISGGSNLVDKWVEGEVVIKTDDVPYRLQLQCDDTSGSIVVDYIQAIELMKSL